jgi:AraC-like DNA-binding protein
MLRAMGASQQRAIGVQKRSFLVAPLLAHVRQRGGDPERLLRRLGRDALGPEPAKCVEISLDALRVLFDGARCELDDPFLGLHFAEHVERGTFGIVELYCSFAPTLGEGLNVLADAYVLIDDLVVMRYRDGGDHAVLEHGIPNVPGGVGRELNEFWAAYMLVNASRVTGRRVIPRAAFFAHVEPHDVSELTRVIGTGALRFGAEMNGLVLDAADRDAPLVTADAALAAVLREHVEQLTHACASGRSFLDRVRLEVQTRLSDGEPTLESVARALRLAPRTLQRHLAREGATLSGVVESVRRERAHALVVAPDKTVAAIAWELGYADPRAFLRAFKRWTGTTPRRSRTA